MAVTMAERYEDYPSAKHFTWDKENPDRILTYKDYGLSAEENGSRDFAKSPVTVYWENIYAGYRYFDTFHKEVLFPFGYGLSYTDFQIKDRKTEKTPDGIHVSAVVKNTGFVPGKEVVQVYLSKPDQGSGLECPYQELKGFEKTALISPGGKEEVQIQIPWRELAVYDEIKAAWVIEAGEYILRAGNSSRNTEEAGMLHVEQNILTEQCRNRLSIAKCNRGKIDFLSRINRQNNANVQNESNCIVITSEDIISAMSHKILESDQAEQILSDLSNEELAALCVGYGSGTPLLRSETGVIRRRFLMQRKILSRPTAIRQEVRDMFLPLSREKGSTLYLIKTDLRVPAALHGLQGCCSPALLTESFGMLLETRQDRSVKNNRWISGWRLR